MGFFIPEEGTIFKILTPILIIMIIITLSLKWYSGKLKTDFKNCQSKCDGSLGHTRDCAGDCAKSFAHWKEHKDSIFRIDAEEMSMFPLILSGISGVICFILFIPFAVMAKN